MASSVTFLPSSTSTRSTSNDDVVLKDITNFFTPPKRLGKKQQVEFAFQKSTAGATGLTYLPLDFDFKWVVKWQNRSLSEVEYLCTQFYRRAFADLTVPLSIYSMPPELRKKIKNHFENISVAPDHVPVLLEYRDGNTLVELCKNENLFRISKDELVKLFCFFGEIAGYDFLISNCDRFIPQKLCDKIDKDHTINGGNILIELEVSSFTESYKLLAVYPIDNTPHLFTFFDLSERRIEEDDDDNDVVGVGDIFDKSESTSNIQAFTPLRISGESGEKLRAVRHQEFYNFVGANEHQIVSLTRQIWIGIYNELKGKVAHLRPRIDLFYRQNTQVIENGLCTGLIKAQQNMKNPRLSLIVEDLKKETNGFSKSAQIVLDFISKNLIFAQKLNLKV